MKIFPVSENFTKHVFASASNLIKKNGTQNQVLGRLNFGLGATISLISTPLDAIAGSISGSLSLIKEAYESLKIDPNLGDLKKRHRFTIRCLNYCAGFSQFFGGFLLVINPAVFDPSDTPTLIASEGSGLFSHHVRKFIVKHAKIGKSNDWKDRIKAKILYGSLIPVCLVTRIMDFAIGILAASFAFAAGGSIRSLNNCAYRGLMIDHFIQDFFLAAIKLINLNSSISLNADSTTLQVNF